MSKEVTVELREPFKYAAKDGGDAVDASFVTLCAPNYRQLQHSTPIKQAFSAAIKEIAVTDEDRERAKAEQGKGDDGITGAQALHLLYSWSGDAQKILLHAAELFKSGVALVDGEVRVTAPILDKMSGEDFENIVGEYLANFIVPSLMNGTKNDI